MKITFFVALLLGFVGVLAAGHFVPWGSHVRLPSQTRVVANGGRDVVNIPLEPELGRMNPDHAQALILVFGGPLTHVW